MPRRRRRNREGGIYYRKDRDTYTAQIYLEGKRISKTFETEPNALRWLREMSAQIEAGMSADIATATVKEFSEYWLHLVKRSRSPKTFSQYKGTIKGHILPALAARTLISIKPRDINQLLLEREDSGVSTRQVQIIRTALNQLFKQARMEGLPYNPVDGVYRPKYEAPEMRPLSQEEAARFRQTIRGNPFEGLFYLAVAKGPREGELLGLQWIDVDWETPALHIRRQVQRVTGKGIIFRPTKTKKSNRLIFLGEEEVRLLELQKEHNLRMKLKAGKRWQEHNLIFPSTVGTPMDAGNLMARFKRILKAANLPNIRFHDLRHTFATLALLQDIHPKVVSEIMGHRDITVTLKVYSHMIPSLQKGVAAMFEEMLNDE